MKTTTLHSSTRSGTPFKYGFILWKKTLFSSPIVAYHNYALNPFFNDLNCERSVGGEDKSDHFAVQNRHPYRTEAVASITLKIRTISNKYLKIDRLLYQQ